MSRLPNTLILIVLLACFPSASVAQIELADPVAPLVLETQLAPDVRVIIDISGSMKKNDPNNLRRPALELLVRLFPEQAKAGVWTFGQWVNMLVNHQPVDGDWRKLALEKAKQINSVALRTNIPEALLKATNDIDKLDPRFKTHLILLTDGMVDVDPSATKNNQAREQILSRILPRLTEAGVTVHTIALSRNADRELMERLAVETGGLYAVAETAEDLMRIFLQAFDASAPSEQLPLDGNKFLVDDSIDEFTALLFRKEGSEQVVLNNPLGVAYRQDDHPSKVSWFRESGYDLITVKNPQPGEWLLVAELEPDSRVTIVSNLSLQVNTLPKSIFANAPADVVAALKDRGNTITNGDFLRLVDLTVAVSRREDGLEWDFSLSDTNPVPEQGVFAAPLTMFGETGTYDITVKAEGKTFDRQRQQTLTVRNQFDINVESAAGDVPQHSVTVFARNRQVNTEATTIEVAVQRPDGSQETRLATAVDERRWQLDLLPVAQSGRYELQFAITGRDNGGKAFAYSASHTIEHMVAGMPVPTPEPVEPVAAPVPPPQPEPAPTPVPEPVVVPPPAPEPQAEQGVGMAEIALYGGLVIGNLLVLALGYFAYRMVMGSKTESDILDDDDEVVLTAAPAKAAAKMDKIPPVQSPEPEPEPELLNLDDDADITMANDETLDDIIEEVDLDIPDDELDQAVEQETVDEQVSIDDLLDEEPTSAPPKPTGSSIDDLDVTDIDDILDLPDDAIDIDPEADDDDKR